VLETPPALADARLPELRTRIGALLVSAAAAMATAYFDDPGVVCMHACMHAYHMLVAHSRPLMHIRTLVHASHARTRTHTLAP
jgi:hypothetical protein